MPSSSRKRNKGQARKAKAAATGKLNNNPVQQQVNFVGGSTVFNNGRSIFEIPNHSNSRCYHGQVKHTPKVCVQFIAAFFHSYLENNAKPESMNTLVNGALKTAYDKFPEVITNKNYLEIIKKSMISNGVSSLQEGTPEMSLTIVSALLLIDSYTPSCPARPGTFICPDPKKMLRSKDILNGCRRSLVKFFVNQIPCNCLDDLYDRVKSTTPKMSLCPGCQQRKERKSMLVCTGCERVQYCSKACQLAFVPKHKQKCKRWRLLL